MCDDKWKEDYISIGDTIGLIDLNEAIEAFRAKDETKKFGKIKYVNVDSILDDDNNMATIVDNKLVDLINCDGCDCQSTIEDILFEYNDCCLQTLNDDGIMNYEKQIEYFVENFKIEALKSLDISIWCEDDLENYLNRFSKENEEDDELVSFFKDKLKEVRELDED